MKDLEEWIIQLRETEKIIIVEGEKDKKALESFGIYKTLTLKRPLFSIVEEIAEIHKECIILSDLDKEGKKIYSNLKHNLQNRGVKIDNKFREFLFKNTKLTNIEGLTRYYNKTIQKL